MDWLNDKFDLVVNSITNLFDPESSVGDPNNLVISKVVEISKFADQVSVMPVKSRHRSLILYGEIERPSKYFSKYNIILHVPVGGKSFILFQTDHLISAQQLFAVFSRSIPQIVEANPSICSKENLQKFCGQLEAKQFWECTHLAAHFNLFELFHDSSFVVKLNEQESEMNETPIMIAIRQDNLNSVRALIDFNVRMDLKDSRNNTVLHFACKYSPVSVKMLLERYPEIHAFTNEINDDGESCLYLAKEGKHSDSTKLLLKHGANPNLIFKVE